MADENTVQRRQREALEQSKSFSEPVASKTDPRHPAKIVTDELSEFSKREANLFRSLMKDIGDKSQIDIQDREGHLLKILQANKNVVEKGSGRGKRLSIERMETLLNALENRQIGLSDSKNKEFQELISSSITETKEAVTVGESIQQEIAENLKERRRGLVQTITSAIGEENPFVASVVGFAKDITVGTAQRLEDAKKARENQLKQLQADIDQAAQQEEIVDEVKEGNEKAQEIEKVKKKRETPMLDKLERIALASEENSRLLRIMAEEWAGVENVEEKLEKIKESTSGIDKDMDKNNTLEKTENKLERMQMTQAANDDAVDEFANIERMREAANDPEVGVPKAGTPKGKKGGFELPPMLRGIGKIAMRFIAPIAATFGIIAKFAGKLAPVAKFMKAHAGKLLRFGAPLMAVFGFIKGFFESADNIASKLGKDVNDISTSDRVASGLGGALGNIVGIIDSVAGLFGIKTDFGGFIDEKVSGMFSGLFDGVKGFFGFDGESEDAEEQKKNLREYHKQGLSAAGHSTRKLERLDDDELQDLYFKNFRKIRNAKREQDLPLSFKEFVSTNGKAVPVSNNDLSSIRERTRNTKADKAAIVNGEIASKPLMGIGNAPIIAPQTTNVNNRGGDTNVMAATPPRSSENTLRNMNDNDVRRAIS